METYNQFNHLKIHSQYYNCEGATKINDLADFCKKRHQIVYDFLLSIGVDKDVAKNDAEGLEHHVSNETLKVFESFSLKHK